LLDAGARVIGFDRDLEALTHARRRLAGFGERFTPAHGSFAQMDEALGGLGVDQVDGVLLDLGVSSHQLDTAGRGFSFMRDGPLDMRMDVTRGVTAAELVNTASEEELETIFRRFGEEPAAGRIARGIGAARSRRPLRTTHDLVAVVERAAPRRGKTHPATRVFQALRIAVNDELDALERGLGVSGKLLRSGGRLAVITFQSLEDRIVKHTLRALAAEEPGLRIRTKRPLVPSEAEIERNPRARSAKLRAVEMGHAL
jgi:16S rRNA (cytosine1402-N4)-methyltransferase